MLAGRQPQLDFLGDGQLLSYGEFLRNGEFLRDGVPLRDGVLETMGSASNNTSNSVCRLLGPEDLPAIAEIHRDAFPHTLLTAFGDRCLQKFYKWHLEGEHGVATIGVECQGTLVGFCVLLWRSELSGFLKTALPTIVWRIICKPTLLLRPEFGSRLRGSLGLSVGRKKTEAPPTSMRILSIAVRPAFQRMRLGQKLLNTAAEIARQNGAESLGLSVHVDNLQALHSYTRNGWERVLVDGVFTGQMRKTLR